MGKIPQGRYTREFHEEAARLAPEEGQVLNDPGRAAATIASSMWLFRGATRSGRRSSISITRPLPAISPGPSFILPESSTSCGPPAKPGGTRRK